MCRILYIPKTAIDGCPNCGFSEVHMSCMNYGWELRNIEIGHLFVYFLKVDLFDLQSSTDTLHYCAKWNATSISSMTEINITNAGTVSTLTSWKEVLKSLSTTISMALYSLQSGGAINYWSLQSETELIKLVLVKGG